MSRAVRFDEYGGIDVLKVVDVDPPAAGPGQVVVAVKAAGINPGEAKIRQGLLHERWPATFPSGQGSDLAEVVEQVGDGVKGIDVGEEVIGFTDERASQAELVAVDAGNLTPKPPGISWEVAGALFVVGATAYAAVRAVAPGPGDTVVVSGAAGGVGSLVVQLAGRTGAAVIGLASEPNHQWLSDHGVIRSAMATASPIASARPRAAGSTHSSTPSAAATSSWRWSWGSRPTESTPSPTSKPPPGTASRPTVTPPAPARRLGPN